jgi:hypothetical protein
LPFFLSGTFDTDYNRSIETYCQTPLVPPSPGLTAECPSKATPADCQKLTGPPGQGQYYACFDATPPGLSPPFKPYPNGCSNCKEISMCFPGGIPPNMFNFGNNWNTIDRQTNLKDIGGSLSGRQTDNGELSFIINNDEFFYGPNSELECKSLNSSLVIPHHFGRIVLRPAAWKSDGSCKTSSATVQCKITRIHRLNWENSGIRFLEQFFFLFFFFGFSNIFRA